jgi:hypothetical protein
MMQRIYYILNRSEKAGMDTSLKHLRQADDAEISKLALRNNLNYGILLSTLVRKRSFKSLIFSRE